MKKILVSLITAVCAVLLLHAQPMLPKREFRGAWIQAVNGQFRGMSAPQMQQTLRRQLDALQQAGINAVIFQVRPAADALYPSEIEPWSAYLTGVQGQAPDPFWDPLQFMIDECHRRHMELHAWINPYRAQASQNLPLAPGHAASVHPEWFLPYGTQLFFNPALQESRDHIVRVVSDIVTRYDVDAIHMDDYFYPYPVAGEEFPDDDWYQQAGGASGPFADKADWRRHNVNLLIEQLHRTIRALKPWVKFGVSPFGIYRNERTHPDGSATNGLQNYDDLYADVLLWARNGWIDYNIPQIYWQQGHPAADYDTLVQWWAAHAEGRPLYIGQSIPNTVQYTSEERDELAHKLRVQRAFPTVEGACFWYAAALADNEGGVRDALTDIYHRYPALLPASPFIDDKAPGKVKKLKPLWMDDGYVLFWKAPSWRTELDRPVRYAVYRFPKGAKADIGNPACLVGFTYDTFFRLPYASGAERYTYCVTALDRLHNESTPATKKVRL